MTEPVPRSLHEHDFKHLGDAIAALDRVLSERITALGREMSGQLCSVDRRHTELAQARDKAVDIALTAQKEKAQAHNELLAAMKEQQGTFCTKEQAELQSSSLAKRLDAVEKFQVADAGKEKGIGMSASLVMQLLIAASVIISIVVFFANK